MRWFCFETAVPMCEYRPTPAVSCREVLWRLSLLRWLAFPPRRRLRLAVDSLIFDTPCALINTESVAAGTLNLDEKKKLRSNYPFSFLFILFGLFWLEEWRCLGRLWSFVYRDVLMIPFHDFHDNVRISMAYRHGDFVSHSLQRINASLIFVVILPKDLFGIGMRRIAQAPHMNTGQ